MAKHQTGRKRLTTPTTRTQRERETPRGTERVERPGTPGSAIFTPEGKPISGYLHSYKTGDPTRERQKFFSRQEEKLALYLEYHPHVLRYQRGDVSPEFAHAHNHATPIQTPYAIAYTLGDDVHDYWPDFVGTLTDGSLLIAEAGLAAEKERGMSRVKALAAGRLAALPGGVYWIGTDRHLSDTRYYNLVSLHHRRAPFRAFAEIAAVVQREWQWREPVSVLQWIERLGGRWPAVEIEGTIWKLVGDAAATGHLIVDLSRAPLDRAMPLALLEPEAPPILPDPLPSLLEDLSTSSYREAASAYDDASLIVDGELIVDSDDQAMAPALRLSPYQPLARFFLLALPLTLSSCQ